MRDVSDVFVQELADRYRIERAIGEGGMGTVYLAHDQRHDRPVVVKVMRPEFVSADGGRRFVREILVTAKLHHPNILSLLDSGTAAGSSYYVVPLVAGGSLRERLNRQGALPLDVVVQIVSDVAGALDHAHAHGVVHRDIKPENILLEGDRAIVADFGIAHAVDEASGERLTASGLALGTPAYMSPEQSDPSHIDGRSDLYSLGCVLYEMLTGHAPFSGSTPQEAFVRHAIDPVPSMRSARPGLPPQLERVLQTALAKSPADRYQTGRSLVQALESAITSVSDYDASQATQRFGAGPGAPAKGARARRRLAVSALAVVALTGTSFFVWRSTVHAAFGSRDWIVVADLAGNAADSTLHNALRDALMLTLQQSRYVNVERPSAIAQTIRMMGRPDSTHLTEAVAREVALRLGARAVLLPSLTRLDSTYLFTARAISPQTGGAIVTIQERADGHAHILDALDRLAVDLRKQLGEHLRDADPAMALDRATTPSLEALEAWTRGNQHFKDGNYGVAESEYERAVTLDSDFALAHKALGVTFYWMNRRDLGDAHFQRALALGNRLTERERLLIRADVAGWRNQAEAAVGLYQEFLAQYPDDEGARYSLGFVLLGADRCREAIDVYQWLRAHDSTDAGVRINLATCYSKLHRFPEALAQYRAAFALRPQWARSGNNVVGEYGQTLIQAGLPASAESLYRVQLDGDAAAHARAHRSLAMLNLYRGKSAAARDLLRQAITEDVGSSSATSRLRDQMYLIRALVDAGETDSARDQLRSAVEFARQQTLDPPWLADLAQLAIRLGDGRAVKELEARVRSRVQPGNAGDASTLHELEGEVALAAGNFGAARDHFDAALAARRRPQSLSGAAQAALGQGRRKDAEALFEEVVALGPEMTEALPGFFEAHLELGRLAAARGDTTAARQHLGWIMTQWANGDSDLVVRHAAASELASFDIGKRNGKPQ